MVVARWATLAQAIGCSAESLTMRGLSRARIISAYGDVPPHAAVLEVGDDVRELGDLPERIAEAHRLLAALDRGARPSHRAWVDELQAAIAALLRAVSDPSAPAELVALPTPEALRKRAQDLVTTQAAHEASCELEAALAKLSEAAR